MALNSQFSEANISLPPPKSNLEKELEEQREILLKIYAETQKTKRYIIVGRVINFIYLLLIVVPLIFAAIYLPPLIQNYLGPYQELLGGVGKLNGLSDIMEQLEK